MIVASAAWVIEPRFGVVHHGPRLLAVAPSLRATAHGVFFDDARDHFALRRERSQKHIVEEPRIAVGKNEIPIVKEPAASGGGLSRWLAQRFPFVSSSFEARIKAAQEGMGITQAAVGAGADHSGLLRIGLQAPLPPVRFYLAMHRDLRKTPRMRAVASAIESIFVEYAASHAAEEARDAKRRPRLS